MRWISIALAVVVLSCGCVNRIAPVDKRQYVVKARDDEGVDITFPNPFNSQTGWVTVDTSHDDTILFRKYFKDKLIGEVYISNGVPIKSNEFISTDSIYEHYSGNESNNAENNYKIPLGEESYNGKTAISCVSRGSVDHITRAAREVAPMNFDSIIRFFSTYVCPLNSNIEGQILTLEIGIKDRREKLYAGQIKKEIKDDLFEIRDRILKTLNVQ